MEKEITRIGKIISVEIKRKVFFSNNKPYDFLVDSKSFNLFLGSFLGLDPTQKTYDKANKWADNAIALHKKNTQ